MVTKSPPGLRPFPTWEFRNNSSVFYSPCLAHVIPRKETGEPAFVFTRSALPGRRRLRKGSQLQRHTAEPGASAVSRPGLRPPAPP